MIHNADQCTYNLNWILINIQFASVVVMGNSNIHFLSLASQQNWAIFSAAANNTSMESSQLGCYLETPSILARIEFETALISLMLFEVYFQPK